MVRWRCVVVLAVLLLLPARIGSKLDEEEEDQEEGDEERADELEEDDNGDEEEEEVESGGVNKDTKVTVVRQQPLVATAKKMSVTRTVKKHPLECFVCAYKSEMPLRACLDPIKYRVHTITCQSVDDRCFTSVISKGSMYETVARGCRSGCVGSSETTCCELNRCNSQAFTIPAIAPQSLAASKSNKTMHPTILFFVTVLLVLQTVVKVAFV